MSYAASTMHEIYRIRSLETCLAAVRKDWTEIRTMKNGERNEFVCLEAVRQNGLAVRYLRRVHCSEEVCIAAVLQNPHAIDYLKLDQITPAVLEAARASGACTRSEAVAKTWAMLRAIPPGQRGLAACLAAVKLNGFTIREMSDEERVPDVCLEAVRENGRAVRYLTPSQRTPWVCEAAARENGLAIEYLQPEQRSQAVCIAAVEQNTDALNLLTHEQLTHEVVLAGSKRHWWDLGHLSFTPLMWTAVVREYPDLYDHVPYKKRSASVLASIYAAQQDRGITTVDGLLARLPLEIVLINIFSHLDYKDLFG